MFQVQAGKWRCPGCSEAGSALCQVTSGHKSEISVGLIQDLETKTTVHTFMGDGLWNTGGQTCTSLEGGEVLRVKLAFFTESGGTTISQRKHWDV